MPELDDQLRAVARLLDENVAPVDADEILSGAVARPRPGWDRRRLAVAVVAVASLAAAVALGAVLTVSRHDTVVHVGATTPTHGKTVPSTARRPTTATVGSTSPQTEPCVLRHAPGDVYSLAQPATVTLPTGDTTSIVPGNPITRPDAVTLDSDGSTYPGQAGANGAASLLWGSDAPGGPFAGLHGLAVGQVITLRQTIRSSTETSDCVQHWRIIRRFTPPIPPWTEPTLLRLVGFTPHGTLGPTAQFYVDAVPA